MLHRSRLVLSFTTVHIIYFSCAFQMSTDANEINQRAKEKEEEK